MTRIATIDHLKTLGIFLVVFGHSHYFGFISQLIYAFHMPLFFLISGFLARRPENGDTPIPYITRVLKSLAPPYFFYAFIGYLFWAFSAQFLGSDTVQGAALYEPLLGTLYGTGTPDEIRVKPVVLWFLPCLFLSQVFLYLLLRWCRNFCWLISAIITIPGFLLPAGIALPLEFETALVTQFFVVTGYHIRKLSFKKLINPSYYPAWGLVALLSGTLIVALHSSHIDVRSSKFGNPACFLSAALLLSLACTLLTSRLPQWKWSQFISENSLVIFSLHLMAFSVIKLISSRLFPDQAPWLSGPLFAFTSSILICIILAYLGKIIFRFLPWSFGVKGKTVKG